MAVEKWVNDSQNIYNPYDVYVYFNDGKIYLDNGNFIVGIPLDDDSRKRDFKVSTRAGCGIGFHDLDEIDVIKDSMNEIIEIYIANIMTDTKKTAMKRMDDEFEGRMAEIKASGSDWKDYAKYGKELADEAMYWMVCLDVVLANKSCELKQRLDSWIMDNLSEDDACQYFRYLD